MMQKGLVHGIIYIPEDFDARLVRGEQGIISTYADMSSFLYYKCLTMGASLTMLDEMHEIQMERYLASGMDAQAAWQAVQPVLSDESMPYNKPFSYTIFFISPSGTRNREGAAWPRNGILLHLHGYGDAHRASNSMAVPTSSTRRMDGHNGSPGVLCH